MTSFNGLVGQRFGHLVVRERTPTPTSVEMCIGFANVIAAEIKRHQPTV
jgi:hypothetical protein